VSISKYKPVERHDAHNVSNDVMATKRNVSNDVMTTSHSVSSVVITRTHNVSKFVFAIEPILGGKLLGTLILIFFKFPSK